MNSTKAKELIQKASEGQAVVEVLLQPNTFPSSAFLRIDGQIVSEKFKNPDELFQFTDRNGISREQIQAICPTDQSIFQTSNN